MDADFMRIIEGRRYMYKGVKRGIAIEGNISAYEYILEGMVKLQLGYDQQRIDAGVLLINSKRSDKSPFGTTADLIKMEVDWIHSDTDQTPKCNAILIPSLCPLPYRMAPERSILTATNLNQVFPSQIMRYDWHLCPFRCSYYV